ncbi:MAG: glycine betaine ABC transporter substrate-binding protein [Anaerolineales bacterium]|jgi:osmoprotectant transport system substrate-binding protein
MKRRYYLIFTLLVLALVASACGGGAKETIRVSSKAFTEQYILGNMYQMLLEDAGFTTTYSSVGGTAENHQALLEDQIDVYPEYTGTALLTHLGMSYDPSMSQEDVYNTVKSAYEEQFGLTWLDQTAFNNTYCLTMTQAKAQELNVKTVSDLAQKAPELVFGTTQEFTEREDGLPGLKQTYGGFEFKEVLGLDPGLLYSGLDEGDIDVTTCFGTDGQISAYNLVVLDDDKNFWPPYPVAPVVRQDTLEADPGIADALNKLAPLLDGPTMSALNWEVAGNSREADEVAREFLVQNGLISGQ